jgi:hypothetical protein
MMFVIACAELCRVSGETSYFRLADSASSPLQNSDPLPAFPVEVQANGDLTGEAMGYCVLRECQSLGDDSVRVRPEEENFDASSHLVIKRQNLLIVNKLSIGGEEDRKERKVEVMLERKT